MRRAEKLLRELRAELKNPPAQPSNESAIERTLEGCIADVHRFNSGDQVFLSRDTLEAFVHLFETTPLPLMDEEKRSLLTTVKEALGEK